jgi:hypothetical protein
MIPRVVTENMVMIPVGPEIKSDCAGEGQQQLTWARGEGREQVHDSQIHETEK